MRKFTSTGKLIHIKVIIIERKNTNNNTNNNNDNNYCTSTERLYTAEWWLYKSALNDRPNTTFHWLERRWSCLAASWDAECVHTASWVQLWFEGHRTVDWNTLLRLSRSIGQEQFIGWPGQPANDISNRVTWHPCEQIHVIIIIFIIIFMRKELIIIIIIYYYYYNYCIALLYSIIIILIINS